MDSSKNYSDSDAGPSRSLETKCKQKANDEGLAAPPILVSSKPSHPTSSMMWEQLLRMVGISCDFNRGPRLSQLSSMIYSYNSGLIAPCLSSPPPTRKTTRSIQKNSGSFEIAAPKERAKCHQRNLIHVKDRSVPYNRRGANIHAALKYTFVVRALNNNERPDLFKRQQSTNAGEDASRGRPSRRLVRPRGGRGGLIAS
ncbi:hypothetical protein INT43_003523 [Umbelopsis isabellina]|uniref:Uncharacterized protein n=1 Tax=Mortierella isabellina TaxID=91625 RepID=A0A8H7PQX6_MORIS|nr:hypothetical protein INT43_003523 [Umbelopsis isabellina]